MAKLWLAGMVMAACTAGSLAAQAGWSASSDEPVKSTSQAEAEVILAPLNPGVAPAERAPVPPPPAAADPGMMKTPPTEGVGIVRQPSDQIDPDIDDATQDVDRHNQRKAEKPPATNSTLDPF